MDIYLASEHTYYFPPQIALGTARDQVEPKKTGLVAGMVGALLTRPRPEDVRLTAVENRLEPFWLVTLFARTVYNRQCTYIVPVSGPEVQRVTVLGQEVMVEAQAKGAPGFSLAGVEHCVEEQRMSYTFDGLSGHKADLSKYLSFAKTEVLDLATFAPEGVLVVPPQVRASAVVRQMMAEVVRPVQQAQDVLEERVEFEVMDLNFRPVYALEYEWTAKGKKVVVELDALTGEMRTGGKRLSEQLRQLKGMLTRDVLFDVTADAMGLIVPGGSIAVKLVKAVVDYRGR
ncbi:MAG: hypothetical protein C4310_07375 [Chloroflexota bacterium]